MTTVKDFPSVSQPVSQSVCLSRHVDVDACADQMGIDVFVHRSIYYCLVRRKKRRSRKKRKRTKRPRDLLVKKESHPKGSETVQCKPRTDLHKFESIGTRVHTKGACCKSVTLHEHLA